MRHALPVILALTLAAVLAGARSFTAIGEWVTDPDHAFLVQLGATGSRLPSESTIRRVLGRVDGHVVDEPIGAFMWLLGRVDVRVENAPPGDDLGADVPVGKQRGERASARGARARRTAWLSPLEGRQSPVSAGR